MMGQSVAWQLLLQDGLLLSNRQHLRNGCRRRRFENLSRLWIEKLGSIRYVDRSYQDLRISSLWRPKYNREISRQTTGIRWWCKSSGIWTSPSSPKIPLFSMWNQSKRQTWPPTPSRRFIPYKPQIISVFVHQRRAPGPSLSGLLLDLGFPDLDSIHRILPSLFYR